MNGLVSKTNIAKFLLKIKDKLSNRFFTKLFVLYSVVTTFAFLFLRVGFIGLKKDYKEETSSLKQRVADLTDRLYSQTKLTAKPVIQEERMYLDNCIDHESTIFSKDKLYAACLVTGTDGFPWYIVVAGRAMDSQGKLREGYISLNEFLTQYDGLTVGDDIFLFFSGFTDGMYNPLQGSRIFRFNEKARLLELTVDQNSTLSTDSPFGVGRTDTPQFQILSSKKDVSSVSPDNRFILVWASSCIECSTSLDLYAYDSVSKTLKYIGLPYINDGGKFSIEWLSSNTLKWREGKWRDATEEEARKDCEEKNITSGRNCPPPFPVVQEDLGDKITIL